MNIENFTGKAEAYAIGRLGYPNAAIDYICSLVPQDAVFADIGAGTGKFTVTLAERGYSVFDRNSVDGLLRCDRITKVYSERMELSLSRVYFHTTFYRYCIL